MTNEAITFVIAIFGAALGVLNTCTNIWLARRRTRVKLSVTAKMGYQTTNGWIILARGLQGLAPEGLDIASPSHVAIEVINLSEFPVSVDEFGIDSGDFRALWQRPVLSEGKSFPARLAFREAVTATIPIGGVPLNLLVAGRPYCSIESGTISRGDNKAWREYSQLVSRGRSPD